ncbi:transposase [Priestia flexa]|uniref:IS66 family transposase n=1 Tax=Priestia flexa TaxID=86664 RepID=UPI0028906D89|nr:transposase [Priestia flexa]MDT2048515.1 transposase [Priestia flexa]MDT2048520.1 transposase [Priestia flexa]
MTNHDAEKLLNRISKRQDSVLLLAVNPNVPFDNSLAERDLRMEKVKQKVLVQKLQNICKYSLKLGHTDTITLKKGRDQYGKTKSIQVETLST